MNIFKILRRIVPLHFIAAPWVNGFQMLLSAISASLWALSIIVTQRLFDAVIGAADGELGFVQVVVPLLWMTLVIFGQQALNGLYMFMITVIFEKCSGFFQMRLFTKLSKIDPVMFEDTKFLDSLNKAKEAIRSIPHFCMAFTTLFFFHIVYFAFVGSYLFWLSPVLVMVLIISFVPAFLSLLFRVKVFTKLEEKNAPLRRENDYYRRTICDREYFKETRILGAYHFFYKLYNESVFLLTDSEWRAESKTAIIQLALNIISFCGMGISTLMLFNATMDGTITVGSFAAVFGALNMIFGMMDEIVNDNLTQRSKDIGKVINYIHMLDTPERQPNEENHREVSSYISAEDLYFTYPGKDEPAVRSVFLDIAKNETIAIVGENGAGKSTLMRLLTGIYKPDRGYAAVNGRTSGMDFSDISGVFQKFKRYKMTLKENVTISDRRRIGGYQNERVNRVLKEADLELGMDMETMLSPEFNGIDLSGGQWQRLAIARGLYRESKFIVLDEPTAAIDPLEEVKVYNQFQKLAANKCAVVVTHRLGSVRLANRIVVMDAGEILDIGTHEELLSRSGKYAEMWEAQARWYER